ncbi:MAG: enoyl-CoA hydratase/isomerase family protein [Bacteroidetes bacterium]|nr:enoyl-CoA hydratase/isomerase family protein [Bacteroidota bacterium]MBS1739672.1 enoyl-CoA hydratase/isomerase family protein [Bacteroidota bacterium]MBS1774932.1 enoyl-CoA hydratase/isomerase family protein [Bacteroidota bacterium]
MYQTLLTDLQDGTFIITINRPDKLNALNKDVIEELGQAINEVYNNEAIKTVILTGAGEKGFVAGADISEFTALDAAGGAALAKKGQDHVFDKIENCPKPVIAAVNGFALGGGCELAMSCHFRVAAENAKFGQPEVNLGLIPGYGGTQRLTQLIGKGKAMELMMTADMIGAEEAKSLGLVNHVFPLQDLMAETKKIAQKIQTKAPIAISQIIASINEAAKGETNGFANEIKRFGLCFSTSDMKEGTTAFLEKRKASFVGK